MPEPVPEPSLPAPAVPEAPRPLSWRDRFRESAPLAAVGLAFIAGAALASVDRLRVLSSNFPLWILLALDGGVAVVAGGMAFFVAEPDRPIDDDPNVVRVPKAEWESLLRRLEIVSRTPGSRGGAPEWSESWAPVPVAAHSLTSTATAPASVPPAATAASGGPSPAGPAGAPSREDLRREMGWLELQGFAESAVTTGESLGGHELRNLLDASGADLARIANELGRPREPGEPPLELLLRLLRDDAGFVGSSGALWRPPELDRLAKRLQEILPKGAAPVDQRRTVNDEFE
ncbi:MAG: hypothetical protein L3K08_06320, partial [Thermoplasmata archaeon]|nr:hypothetical protein [Thermoplasmata archaeon]